MNAVEMLPTPPGQVQWLQITFGNFVTRMLVTEVLYYQNLTPVYDGVSDNLLRTYIPPDTTALGVDPRTAEYRNKGEENWIPVGPTATVKARYLMTARSNPVLVEEMPGFNGPIISWQTHEGQFILYNDEFSELALKFWS